MSVLTAKDRLGRLGDLSLALNKLEPYAALGIRRRVLSENPCDNVSSIEKVGETSGEKGGDEG